MGIVEQMDVGQIESVEAAVGTGIDFADTVVDFAAGMGFLQIAVQTVGDNIVAVDIADRQIGVAVDTFEQMIVVSPMIRVRSS